MITSTFFHLFCFLGTAIAATPQPWGYFVNSTIYQPKADEDPFYPRYVELQDGTILATACIRVSGPTFFTIFESKDGGASWANISTVHDTVNGPRWSFAVQPALAELTKAVGDYPVGTILIAGNAWNRNRTSGGTHIDIYASADKGKTWTFVSNVAKGAAPDTQNGNPAIWEPYILQYEDKIAVYYSDQRDPKHGQKLAHQESKDLKTWGEVINDVTYDEYIARPGMTVVAYIPPIKKWILVHELPKGNSSSYGSNYPVYYVMADSPLEFGKEKGRPIVIKDPNGTFVPNASPYVVWSSVGGPNGTIIVSDADRRYVYTNTHGGDVDTWEAHGVPAGATYSRAIQLDQKYPDRLIIYSGEVHDDLGKGRRSPFYFTAVNLTETLTTPISKYP